MTKARSDLGRPGWSRALTEATDERVARMAAAMRVAAQRRTPWALGKTAATHPGIARGAAKRLGVPRGRYRRKQDDPLRVLHSSIPAEGLVSDQQRKPYAYLLGIYLGDGYLAGIPRSCALVVACDASYTEIIERCSKTMSELHPLRRVRRSKVMRGCVVLTSSGWRWLALFPHHGKGRKHERRIELRDWQREIIAEWPIDFIRGLIESDGCRSIRRQDGKDYPFYSFNNRSEDILQLFGWACDLIGVHYTRPRIDCISIARRKDVAALDLAIGPKR